MITFHPSITVSPWRPRKDQLSTYKVSPFWTSSSLAVYPESEIEFSPLTLSEQQPFLGRTIFYTQEGKS